MTDPTKHRSSIIHQFESFRDDVDEYHDRRERLIKVCPSIQLVLFLCFLRILGDSITRLVEISQIFPKKLFFSFIVVRWKNLNQTKANMLAARTNLLQEKVTTNYAKYKESMPTCRRNLRETSFGATTDKFPLDCKNT